MDLENLLIKEIKALRRHYDSKFVCIGEGRNRRVYDIGKGYVIKIPLNDEGIEDNYYESIVFKKNKSYPFARCRMFGAYLLVMEKLNIDIDRTNLPSWTGFFDCAQVGVDSKGRLKIYDFGLF